MFSENERFADLGAPPEYPDAEVVFYPQPPVERVEEQVEERVEERVEEQVAEPVEEQVEQPRNQAQERQPAEPAEADNFVPGEFPLTPQRQQQLANYPLAPRPLKRPRIVYGPAPDDVPAMNTRARTRVASAPNPASESVLNIWAFHITTPTTIRKAMASPQAREWGEAYQKEIHSFLQNETGQIVELPDGAHEVGGRWLHKLKYSVADIQRTDPTYKARYIAQGHTQIYGTDYDQTYAPVAKAENTNLILAIAASRGWKVNSMDVCSAFLESEMETGRKVYLQIPEGVEIDPITLEMSFSGLLPAKRKLHYSHESCQKLTILLRKSIYGLKQSPRQWYKLVSGFFLEIGFVKATFDGGIFLLWSSPADRNASGRKLLVIAIMHVDDIALVDLSVGRAEEVKMAFEKRFQMSDFGEIGAYIGRRIERHKDLFYID